MKRWMKQLTALLLAAGMVFSLAACGVKAENLMDGVRSQSVPEIPMEDADRAAMADFGLRLLDRTAGENPLISPLSVMTALGMTVNGAEGETLEQMESVLGMDRERLNSVLHTYLNTVEGKNFHAANSIWFDDREDFSVNGDFLQTNADYYGAELYKAPFDVGTVNEINRWVKKHTRGMIPEILSELSPEAVMCLVNALAFEDKWQEPYEKHQIDPRDFHRADGSVVSLDFLRRDESLWLEGENCTGFLKPYKNGRYAFAALLPAEGTTPEQLAAFLDGSALHGILADKEQETVFTAIPKFKVQYGVELKELLKDMGMPLAFGQAADFSGLGVSQAGPISIGSVVHRTFLELDEQGTKAAAATAAVPDATSSAPEEIRKVILDRPFLYMLVDTRENVPFFLGIMDDPTA